MSATKNDQGKPRISLIPASYIEGTAAVFNFGAQKYGADNYRLGLNHSRCIDAALRHLTALLGGQHLDLESGLHHIYHASCSLSMLDYMRINHPNLNDLFELNKTSICTHDRIFIEAGSTASDGYCIKCECVIKAPSNGWYSNEKK